MLITILRTHPERLLDIVAATPWWTWALFAGLLAIGSLQVRPRVMTARRTWSISLLLAGMGLAGLLYSFRASPHVNAGTAVWVALSFAGMLLFARLDVRVRPTHAAGAPEGSVEVEGSWLPLGLIVFAIASRYLATLEIILSPAALQDAAFVLAMSAIYGIVSAGFLGRARAASRAIVGIAAPATSAIARART
jgi:hypothetical protein